jgi:hypothetical protein
MSLDSWIASMDLVLSTLDFVDHRFQVIVNAQFGS